MASITSLKKTFPQGGLLKKIQRRAHPQSKNTKTYDFEFLAQIEDQAGDEKLIKIVFEPRGLNVKISEYMDSLLPQPGVTV